VATRGKAKEAVGTKDAGDLLGQYVASGAVEVAYPSQMAVEAPRFDEQGEGLLVQPGGAPTAQLLLLRESSDEAERCEDPADPDRRSAIVLLTDPSANTRSGVRSRAVRTALIRCKAVPPERFRDGVQVRTLEP
jgi:hypothetical protein